MAHLFSSAWLDLLRPLLHSLTTTVYGNALHRDVIKVTHNAFYFLLNLFCDTTVKHQYTERPETFKWLYVFHQNESSLSVAFFWFLSILWKYNCFITFLPWSLRDRYFITLLDVTDVTWWLWAGQQKVREHGSGALRKWQTKLRKWCKLGKKKKTEENKERKREQRGKREKEERKRRGIGKEKERRRGQSIFKKS